MLHELAARAAEATSETYAYRISAEVLAKNALDLPFVLIYSLSEGADHARLIVSRFGPLPPGRWNAQPERAIVLPLTHPGQPAPDAFLVAGVSPHRALDEPYRRFFRATADHVMAQVANARAHESERRRAAALAELARAKSAFFSNVSHELRTPLTLILGPTTRMLESADCPLAWRHELEVVTRNARTLLKQVNDLLDIARLEAGKQKPDYSAVDLAYAVRLAASHFEVLAREKAIDLRVEAVHALEAEVDDAKFQRVVLNLLSNAFKFTPSRGTIRCALRADPVLDQAVVEVADSGPGSRPISARWSSSASASWARAPRVASAAPAWGWRSPGSSWSSTAAG
jgi:signal transduction histidine kinase